MREKKHMNVNHAKPIALTSHGHSCVCIFVCFCFSFQKLRCINHLPVTSYQKHTFLILEKSVILQNQRLFRLLGNRFKHRLCSDV